MLDYMLDKILLGRVLPRNQLGLSQDKVASHVFRVQSSEDMDEAKAGWVSNQT